MVVSWIDIKCLPPCLQMSLEEELFLKRIAIFPRSRFSSFYRKTAKIVVLNEQEQILACVKYWHKQLPPTNLLDADRNSLKLCKKPRLWLSKKRCVQLLRKEDIFSFVCYRSSYITFLKDIRQSNLSVVYFLKLTLLCCKILRKVRKCRVICPYFAVLLTNNSSGLFLIICGFYDTINTQLHILWQRKGPLSLRHDGLEKSNTVLLDFDRKVSLLAAFLLKLFWMRVRHANDYLHT